MEHSLQNNHSSRELIGSRPPGHPIIGQGGVPRDVCATSQEPKEDEHSCALLGREAKIDLAVPLARPRMGVVEVFSDANWYGRKFTRKSTSGGAIMMGRHCLRT